MLESLIFLQLYQIYQRTSLDQTFDQVFGVNVKGPLYGAKAAFPELLKTQGNIIFTVSNAAFYPAGGGPLYTHPNMRY